MSITSFSQVGIGTPSPNNSAALVITSTNKGLLPPRLTTLQRDAIVTPPAGLQIWCLDCDTSGVMQVYNAATWINMSGTTTLPTQPTNVSATPGNSHAVVSFTASLSVAPITSYTVTASPGGITASGKGSLCDAYQKI